MWLVMRLIHPDAVRKRETDRQTDRQKDRCGERERGWSEGERDIETEKDR